MNEWIPNQNILLKKIIKRVKWERRSYWWARVGGDSLGREKGKEELTITGSRTPGRERDSSIFGNTCKMVWNVNTFLLEKFSGSKLTLPHPHSRKKQNKHPPLWLGLASAAKLIFYFSSCQVGLNLHASLSTIFLCQDTQHQSCK